MAVLIIILMIIATEYFYNWNVDYTYKKLESQGKLFFQKELEGIDKINSQSHSNYGGLNG